MFWWLINGKIIIRFFNDKMKAKIILQWLKVIKLYHIRTTMIINILLANKLLLQEENKDISVAITLQCAQVMLKFE